MTEEPRYDIELTRIFDARENASTRPFTDSDEFCSVVRAGRIPRTPRHRRTRCPH